MTLSSGLCQCGCGRPTTIARGNDASKGWVKGHPVKFVRGHSGHKAKPLGADRYTVDTATGCWNWNGATSQGRAGFVVIDGREVRAYRFLYERENGPIPEGLVLDHRCRNPRCVNPEHLEPVTQGENIRRGRVAAGGAR